MTDTQNDSSEAYCLLCKKYGHWTRACADIVDDSSSQERLIEYVTNDDNIKKAAEGSMEKRRKVLYPQDQTQADEPFVHWQGADGSTNLELKDE